MPIIPDISQLQLPTGSVYNVKDQRARDLIAAINNWDYVLAVDAATTPYGVEWEDGSGTTITGTLVASADVMYKIYLVQSENGGNDIYDEYVSIKTEVTPVTDPPTYNYNWEMFGNTKLPDMTQYVKNKTGHEGGTAGDLAYKDTASANYTPAGTINAQAFTGTQATIEVEGTPEGTINSQAFTGDEATVNVTGTAAAQVFTGNPVNYTPAGTISGADVTVSKTSINSVTSPGTLPSATMPTYTVSNEVLIISAGSFDAGSLPTSEAVSVATDIDTITQPTFTGTQAQITAEGSNAASAVAASGTTTPTGTIEQAVFTGSTLESSGTYTPQGDVDQATFTGTQATITVS